MSSWNLRKDKTKRALELRLASSSSKLNPLFNFLRTTMLELKQGPVFSPFVRLLFAKRFAERRADSNFHCRSSKRAYNLFQTYVFPCHRWLGRNVDDNSVERLLVAEPIPPAGDATKCIARLAKTAALRWAIARCGNEKLVQLRKNSDLNYPRLFRCMFSVALDPPTVGHLFSYCVFRRVPMRCWKYWKIIEFGQM